MKSEYVKQFQGLLNSNPREMDAIFRSRVHVFFMWAKIEAKEADRFCDYALSFVRSFGIKRPVSVGRGPEYRAWRKEVLKRDGCCVECGSLERLEVDHIKPWAFFPDLRFELSNGRVLCHECHTQTDTYLSKLFTVYLPKLRAESI